MVVGFINNRWCTRTSQPLEFHAIHSGIQVQAATAAAKVSVATGKEQASNYTEYRNQWRRRKTNVGRNLLKNRRVWFFLALTFVFKRWALRLKAITFVCVICMVVGLLFCLGIVLCTLVTPMFSRRSAQLKQMRQRILYFSRSFSLFVLLLVFLLLLYKIDRIQIYDNMVLDITFYVYAYWIHRYTHTYVDVCVCMYLYGFCIT